ncbi:hypothetical protein CDEST_10788 [Colletotrichum destructivum]|uniref:Uncharacterized protein n=1 Tax=Colletotrichum destructivum TaxID=34406 RepID=A0AAX4IRA4_9PEZI|nr:hypothetical protein CDEST_10788 [Colletotrichum destructivum]
MGKFGRYPAATIMIWVSFGGTERLALLAITCPKQRCKLLFYLTAFEVERHWWIGWAHPHNPHTQPIQYCRQTQPGSGSSDQPRRDESHMPLITVIAAVFQVTDRVENACQKTPAPF